MRKSSKKVSPRSMLKDGCIRLGEEVAANFRAWFERNFVNPRAGRIGHLSYSRAGAFDDRPGDGLWYSFSHERAMVDYISPLDASEMGYITSHPLIAFQLIAGITDIRGVRCVIRGLTMRTNSLQQKAYRSRYYARDNARRRMLAAERRKIKRRTTTNPCPTAETFREAFSRVGESVEAKLLFGGMVHDLACYVDSCLRIDADGNIVGRNGGIKEWIAGNVPELYPRYKTIMRYKALAMRLRQAMDVTDPVPTSSLLKGLHDGLGDEMPKNTVTRDGSTVKVDEGKAGAPENYKNYYAYDSHYISHGSGSSRIGKTLQGGNTVRNGDSLRKGITLRTGDSLRTGGTLRDGGVNWRYEQVARLLKGCSNTFKDVFDRIDAALDGL